MDAKKRMMFIYDEDYYFYTYNILMILSTLKCFNNNKLFVDYRKISFIIEIIKNESNIKFIENINNNDRQLSLFDREKILSIYTKAIITEKNIARLIFALDKQNLIRIEKGKYSSICVYLNKNSEIINLINTELFNNEKSRIMRLRKIEPRIRTNKYDTFIRNIFNDCEAIKWDV